MARHLDLIGIGPGNPDWITLAAVKAIQSLDVLFVVLKEREVDDLVEFRREVLRRHRPDAGDRVTDLAELLDLGGVLGDDDLVALLAQQVRQRVGERVLVLDEQNAGHVVCLLCAVSADGATGSGSPSGSVTSAAVTGAVPDGVQAQTAATLDNVERALAVVGDAREMESVW